MQGISDESFIKTQGKGKQLNKLIPYPYTNITTSASAIYAWTEHQTDRGCHATIVPVGIVKCLSDCCPMYLDHKLFLLNQTYMAVYCLMNAFSFTVSSTN